MKVLKYVIVLEIIVAIFLLAYEGVKCWITTAVIQHLTAQEDCYDDLQNYYILEHLHIHNSS